MALILGIDTGGTHTDAVALDSATGNVVAWHKTPTTHADLAVGISAAMDGLQGADRRQISLVTLSTTLATNAAIEGLGGRVCALLIGYDEAMLRRYGLTRRIHAAALEFIPGRHDVFGEERSPLDEDALRRAVERQRAQVDAFAVSSYLSVRNPEHELRTAEIVAELTDRPIVAGGAVGRSLDSVRRATTAVLNARLIPQIERLLTAIDRSVAQRSIAAPIMVVRGDGAVMPLAIAKARPVETLLSGPAASAIGAHRLTGRDAALVVDMGGTTTDVALLRDGRPKISDQGAAISDWRTAVRAADVRSFGIGGDSRILADPLDLSIGPQRVKPLSAAAAADPAVAESVARIDRDNVTHRLVPVWEFLTLNGAVDNAVRSAAEQDVCDALREGPLDVSTLAKRIGLADARLLNLRSLIARGLVRRIGLTPTDVLHARGEFQGFDVDSAVRACRIAARESRVDLEAFLSRTHEMVIRQLGEGVLRRAVAEFDHRASDADDRLGRFLLDRSLSRTHRRDPLDVRLEITDPIVALGAPAQAWLPKVARRLHAECQVPDLAGVASAVGAAASQVIEQVEFLLRPLYARSGVTGYVVHGPNERRRFASIAAARSYIEQTGPDLAQARALEAGVSQPRVTQTEHSWDAPSENPGEAGYLMETRFTFTGSGRPDA
ncbi:MAG: hydantoinase/oxoprolinase family protein [Chloroflexota bacterium]|nr:hydantoinase/oxoprolinase family protein [Chloroflexota bacterium]MDE2920325.1 hydantoinase/oxoprolinase family protein [Chloroflexota bacterium]